MKQTKNRIIAFSCALSLASTLSAQVIDYDGNYVTTNTVLNGGSLTGNTGSADLDEGGSSNDSISVIAFGTELTSGLAEYSGTSGGTVVGPRFYGGQQAIRFNSGTNSTGFSGLNQIQNSDQIRRQFTLNGSAADYQYTDALYFNQADWSSLTSGQVGFGTTEVAFSLTTAGFATATTGQIRWLLQDNGNFYVSNTTYASAVSAAYSMTGSAATADTWALYAPTASDLRIPTSGYTISGSTFQNITAVGWVLDVPKFNNGGSSTAVGVAVNSFSSDLVAVPETSSYALILGALALGTMLMRRR